jgi:hypothetical protein
LAEFACDLNRIFGDLTLLVPDDPANPGDIVLDAGVLPLPPAALSIDRIVIRKATHGYNSWYLADALWMSLSLRTCRELGVFLLACVFHGPGETTTLTISHPDSDIRRIIIPAGKLTPADLPFGLSMIPFAFRYTPGEPESHPWMYDSCTHDLPLLALSNEDDCVGGDEQWRRRDTVRIWASSPGTMRLAELLLDVGCSANTIREYALEGDAGCRGVAPMSAELRIFLPGSDGWLYDGDDVSLVPPSTNPCDS